MNNQPEIPAALDPFGALRSMRDANLDAWSKMMIDLVNSEAYSKATSQWLDAYLTMSQPFQHIIETTMTQVLAGLNMPARSDVTSLAERLTNVETLLDDLDARLDDIQHAIQAISLSNHATNTSKKAPDHPPSLSPGQKADTGASAASQSDRSQGKAKGGH